MIFDGLGFSQSVWIQVFFGLMGVVCVIYACAFILKKTVYPKKHASMIRFIGFIDTKRRVFTITVPSDSQNASQKFLYITSPHHDVCMTLPPHNNREHHEAQDA